MKVKEKMAEKNKHKKHAKILKFGIMSSIDLFEEI